MAQCCQRPEYKDGLCEIHYKRSLWLDNSDINNLGIVAFAIEIVPEWVRNETAWFQDEVFYAFFQLYDKKKVNKYDRLLAEIAFRGAAKTTMAKIILLYLCCFGLEKFIVYCSETNTFAVQDIFEVRKELGSNPKIRRFFGIINSKKVKGQDGEWSKDAYMTTTGTYVLARGVGQQIRSALRNSYRPTLIIVNDMYSKESVKTAYTRSEYAKWFFNDMFNAADDLDGKVFFNGTILHEDTVPVTLEQNSSWKVLKYPVMDIDDFHRALNECLITDNEVSLPIDEKIQELENISHLTWKARLNLKYILTKFAESHKSRQVDGFYQEYFHLVVPPGDKPFKNIQRLQMTYMRYKGMNWLKVRFGESDVILPVKVFFGVDPASSTSSQAKYSVIAIVMMDADRRLYIYGYSRGRYSLRDELKPFVQRTTSDTVIEDRSIIARIGVVDEEIRLAKQYHPNGSQIETTQAQEHIYTEVGRIMRVNDALHSIYSKKPVENKIDRDADLLTPYFQTNSAYINLGLTELETELKHFPRGSTVDIIDAIYHAVFIARPADKLDFEEVAKRRRKIEEFDTNFTTLN